MLLLRGILFFFFSFLPVRDHSPAVFYNYPYRNQRKIGIKDQDKHRVPPFIVPLIMGVSLLRIIFLHKTGTRELRPGVQSFLFSLVRRNSGVDYSTWQLR